MDESNNQIPTQESELYNELNHLKNAIYKEINQQTRNPEIREEFKSQLSNCERPIFRPWNTFESQNTIPEDFLSSYIRKSIIDQLDWILFKLNCLMLEFEQTSNPFFLSYKYFKPVSEEFKTFYKSLAQEVRDCIKARVQKIDSHYSQLINRDFTPIVLLNIILTFAVDEAYPRKETDKSVTDRAGILLAAELQEVMEFEDFYNWARTIGVDNLNNHVQTEKNALMQNFESIKSSSPEISSFKSHIAGWQINSQNVQLIQKNTNLSNWFKNINQALPNPLLESFQEAFPGIKFVEVDFILDCITEKSDFRKVYYSQMGLTNLWPAILHLSFVSVFLNEGIKIESIITAEQVLYLRNIINQKLDEMFNNIKTSLLNDPTNQNDPAITVQINQIRNFPELVTHTTSFKDEASFHASGYGLHPIFAIEKELEKTYLNAVSKVDE